MLDELGNDVLKLVYVVHVMSCHKSLMMISLLNLFIVDYISGRNVIHISKCIILWHMNIPHQRWHMLISKICLIGLPIINGFLIFTFFESYRLINVVSNISTIIFSSLLVIQFLLTFISGVYLLINDKIIQITSIIFLVKVNVDV